jgi:hypothetical protein
MKYLVILFLVACNYSNTGNENSTPKTLLRIKPDTSSIIFFNPGKKGYGWFEITKKENNKAIYKSYDSTGILIKETIFADSIPIIKILGPKDRKNVIEFLETGKYRREVHFYDSSGQLIKKMTFAEYHRT